MSSKKGKPQTGLIGFRASNELIERVNRLATLEKRNISQISRILLEEAVEAKEKALGLSGAETVDPMPGMKEQRI